MLPVSSAHEPGDLTPQTFRDSPPSPQRRSHCPLEQQTGGSAKLPASNQHPFIQQCLPSRHRARHQHAERDFGAQGQWVHIFQLGPLYLKREVIMDEEDSLECVNLGGSGEMTPER